MTTENSKTQPAQPDTQPAAATTNPDTQPAKPVPHGEIPVLPPPGSGAPANDTIVQDVDTLMREMHLVFDPGTVFITPAEKKLLVSAQARNHGFIEIAEHSARENPALVPAWLATKFKADYADFEAKTHIRDVFRQFLDDADDSLLVAADRVYRDALDYYEALKTEAKHLPGASTERDRLAEYFKNHARKGTGANGDEAPTQAQVERDVRSLLHGTKEGEVVVRNVKPHAEGGEREVIDETGK